MGPPHAPGGVCRSSCSYKGAFYIVSDLYSPAIMSPPPPLHAGGTLLRLHGAASAAKGHTPIVAILRPRGFRPSGSPGLGRARLGMWGSLNVREVVRGISAATPSAAAVYRTRRAAPHRTWRGRVAIFCHSAGHALNCRVKFRRTLFLQVAVTTHDLPGPAALYDSLTICDQVSQPLR